MRPSTSASIPPALMSGVMAGLDPYVGSITVRSVVTIAARRAGGRASSPSGTALTRQMIDEMVRALRMYVKDPEDLSRCRRALETLDARTSVTTPASFEVTIEHEQDIVMGRGRVRELARGLGFDHTDQIKIATSVSEVARNIYSYARRGTIGAGALVGTKAGIWIHAVDRGPGIPNLEEILSGGYKSKTGMGLGLRACKQLMDMFQIVSGPGTGTRIRMEKFL